MVHFRTHLEYLKKRGKRGEAVHGKIERYEAATGAQREIYNPPPLWLGVLLHLACAGAASQLHSLAPLGANFEVTPWFTRTVVAIHLVGALLVTIVALQAHVIWKTKPAKQVANENKAE
jgi:hypothetical protein